LNPEPRKSIKGSKDLESSQVPNNNSSEILPSSGLGLGPGNLNQKPNPFTTSPTKNKSQNQEFFSVYTQRLTEFFEGLNSSLA